MHFWPVCKQYLETQSIYGANQWSSDRAVFPKFKFTHFSFYEITVVKILFVLADYLPLHKYIACLSGKVVADAKKPLQAKYPISASTVTASTQELLDDDALNLTTQDDTMVYANGNVYNSYNK